MNALWRPFHITARPWTPSDITRDDYLALLEALTVRASEYVNGEGAFIDPVLEREHQYSTPYFAAAAAVLLHEGRGGALREVAFRAMEHATESIATGRRNIPDDHGEFFLAPLTKAWEALDGIAPETMHEHWRERLETPLLDVIEGTTSKTNNWRTYAMLGEWTRARAGLADVASALGFVEDGWLARTQRERVLSTKHSLYQDWNGDPQSLAVEAVGRGNLLGLVASKYDGPSSDEIAAHIDAATAVSLLLQDPTGQCPANGRTDDHVFNDVLYQLIFDVQAERALAVGDAGLAGRYRRASSLSFQSIGRWLRDDEPWAGMLSITKNHFPPEDRVGYQPASQVGNYTGAVLYHLAEAVEARRSTIAELPAPSEVGGYALTLDNAFGAFVANAGGMQVQANLRGDVVPKYGDYWTPLGIVRFSKAGWDSRLGPSDGHFAGPDGGGVTFGPEWRERGEWVRLSEKAEHYRGVVTTQFVHPLMVRCRITYAPVTGVGGPTFCLDLTIIPEGVLVEAFSPSGTSFGLTVPLLVDDGRPLEAHWAEGTATVGYPGEGDEQRFIGLNDGGAFEEGPRVRSTYGWLQGLRYTAEGDVLRMFVHPRNTGAPDSKGVEDFLVSAVGDASYVGTHAAGGYGGGMTFPNGASITLEPPCSFVVELRDGAPVRVETDVDANVTIDGARHSLRAFSPESL